MQANERLFCHWDLVRFVKESHLQKEDGTFLLLSVTDGNQLELMIFLGIIKFAVKSITLFSSSITNEW